MTSQELHERRRTKWRLDGRPVRTLEEAREFMESVGFCTMYPLATPELAPTFIGAWVGAEEKLPTARMAFSDARAAEATELMVRMLRERVAYEANLFGETNFLVAASVFPFFYALAGDRNPQGEAKGAHGEPLSPLARDAFEIIRERGPIARPGLQSELGGAPSIAALDRALNELWSRLKITRVDYNPREGASWDVLYRWSPEAVREGMQLSVAQALSALLSKYLDCVVAAEAEEVERFFSHLAARSRVREAMNALLAAREFSFVQVGHRAMVQVAPPRVPMARGDRPVPRPRAAERRRPRR